MADAAEKQVDVEEATESVNLEEIPLDLKPVGANRFGLLEEKQNHYRIEAKINVTKEMALDPTFYEHIAQRLQQTDVITILREDIAWKLQVIVLDCGHNWATVAEEQFYDYGGEHVPSDPLPSRYAVQWAGTANKWRVTFDKKVIKDGFATKEIAHRFASQHALALKR